MGSQHPLPLRKIFVLKALDVETAAKSEGAVPMQHPLVAFHDTELRPLLWPESEANECGY